MGSCCSSRRSTAIGVEENQAKISSNDHHATENTGTSASNTNTSATKSCPTASNANKPQISSFTITPKYTANLNGTVPTPTLPEKSNSVELTSSAVFPKSNGYIADSSQQQNSTLSPVQTNDILLTTYNNTDHLRASPYLSGINNRKRYEKNKLEEDRFHGFDAPVTNSDSENDGFDSDVEKDVGLHSGKEFRVKSSSNVSLASLIANEASIKEISNKEEGEETSETD